MGPEHNTKSFGVILILLVFSATVSFFPSLNSIALYVAMPLAIVISLLKIKSDDFSKILNNRYILLFVLLYTLIAFSSLYAVYSDKAQQVLHEMLGVLLLGAILIINGYSKRNIPWLYGVYFFFYIGMFIYAKNYIFPNIVFGEERLNDDQLNANTVAYHTFYITFGAYIISECVSSKFIIKLFRIVFLLTIPLSFFIALATASRQVLIIQVPLITLLLYIRYMMNSRYSKTVFIFLTSIAILLSIGYVQQLYEESYLSRRNQIELEDDARTLLLKDAIKVGNEHFLTGVGAGNYVMYSYNEHFSHCTFTELYANNGIFGVTIYSIIVFSLMRTQWKRYRRTKDKMFLIFATFFLIYIIDNVFYVFYNNMWLMGFFAIVMVHSELYYDEYLSKTKVATQNN